MVQAGLVAGDAGVDLVGPSGGGLGHEVGVGDLAPDHADEVGVALGPQPVDDLVDRILAATTLDDAEKLVASLSE